MKRYEALKKVYSALSIDLELTIEQLAEAVTREELEVGDIDKEQYKDEYKKFVDWLNEEV